ncbi:hypothetical protein [Rhizobium sp. BR 362]|uniref:hypothetical protein n=1 Tax=Rhizobium sp. BR 362 TaxID=3040670 RepID=UPI002F3E789F
MSYLVEILLPVPGDGSSTLERIRDELTEAFGGVTMHVDAPADGLWKDGGEVDRDRIVVVEVMADYLDRSWWAAYRHQLESSFEQEEILVRASEIERL